MINHGPLILALLSTPRAVGYATEWQRASGLCIPTSPITLGDLEVGTTWRNFRPLGKDFRA